MSEERSNIDVQRFARIDVSSSRSQMNCAMVETNRAEGKSQEWQNCQKLRKAHLFDLRCASIVG
jgi:hypothetical protein